MTQVTYTPYTLTFKFLAGTSRGVLKTKETYFVCIDDGTKKAYGEAGPLKGLSVDDIPHFEEELATICKEIPLEEVLKTKRSLEKLSVFLDQYIGVDFPSIKFAFETAILDYWNGGKKMIIDGSFFSEQQGILINGLIWMGDETFMKDQIQKKLEQGFSCIKMKIGAIDFETECNLLASIRKDFSAQEITLRVDANGAFSPEDAMTKLEKLASYGLHSIEQPIRQGQLKEMNDLCQKTPLDIALDEELIGVRGLENKRKLLEAICPQYIILKPTLLGGLHESQEWIDLANELGIAWWITSALESNIGLNAITQFTNKVNNGMPQGLGTGQLYHNNIPSPLVIEGEKIYYRPNESAWDLSMIHE